MRPKTAVIILN